MDLRPLFNYLYSSEFVLQQFTQNLENELKLLCDNGVMGLLDLFENLGKLTKSNTEHSLSQPLLNKNSVLGLYVRRIIILFERLTFYQIVLLYESLKDYIKSSINDEAENSVGLKTDESFSRK